MKYFCVHEKVFSVVPDYCVGIVVAQLPPGASCKRNVLSSACDDAVRLLQATGCSVKEYGPVEVWREAFRKVGINPGKFPSSIEALLHRVMKGNAPPSITPPVDLANSVALRFAVPVGVHDIDSITGDLEVRFSRPGESFVPFGADIPEEVPEGELVYADEAGVRTRRWVWRQGERSKVSAGATHIFCPVDGFLGHTGHLVMAARDELARLFREELGAQTRVDLVRAGSPKVLLETGI
ncbi:MAG: phenylalanine--tRNA ligase beta subunit-related protein [Bacillota bacterium]